MASNWRIRLIEAKSSDLLLHVIVFRRQQALCTIIADCVKYTHPKDFSRIVGVRLTQSVAFAKSES